MGGRHSRRTRTQLLVPMYLICQTMCLLAGDREDGEGDRGAEVEGVDRCGGAEEAFQECQVSNHDDDDHDYGDNDDGDDGIKAVQ